MTTPSSIAISEANESIRPYCDMIVARATDGAIGRDGQLLVRIREDLRRFKRLTTGGSLIYGRHTLSSFPGGQPLPGRRSLILSRTLDPDELHVDDGTAVEVFPSIERLRTFMLDEITHYESALACGEDITAPRYHIIGGATVYRQLAGWAGTLYLTEIDRRFDDADTYLEDAWLEPFTVRARGGWHMAGKQKPFRYRFVDYVPARAKG